MSDWVQEEFRKKDELYEYVKNWIEEMDAWGAESVAQCDRFALGAVEFMCDICDIVGWKEEEEDE